MKKGCIISILIVLIFCIVGIFSIYYIFFIPSGIEIDKQKYPITGIDISKHTGQIDFSGLAKHRIDFVFLKATEGGNYIVPKFEENYLKARAISMPTGAYHFFRFNKSGKQQADNFLRVINGKKLNLPLS